MTERRPIYLMKEASVPPEGELRPAPWIPLDDLMDQWAQVGSTASTDTLLKATSCAFAALAHERSAFALVNEQPRSTRQAAFPSSRLYEHAALSEAIDGLQQAASTWADAAFVLDAAQASPSSRIRVDPLVFTLIGSCLVQQQRVLCIAQSLVGEIIACYQQQEEGTTETEHTQQGGWV